MGARPRAHIIIIIIIKMSNFRNLNLISHRWWKYTHPFTTRTTFKPLTAFQYISKTCFQSEYIVVFNDCNVWAYLALTSHASYHIWNKLKRSNLPRSVHRTRNVSLKPCWWVFWHANCAFRSTLWQEWAVNEIRTDTSQWRKKQVVNNSTNQPHRTINHDLLWCLDQSYSKTEIAWRSFGRALKAKG